MAAPWTGNRGGLIGGRYRLVSPLGRGAMGEVWRAEHATLLAPVAIELIDPELLDRVVGTDLRDVLSRFQREAQAAAALRSPHVVQILDHGVEGDCAYMAMELLEGETLSQRLKRVGTLPHAQTARIITHIGRAVTKAHEAGIVHRDLKPENVFIVKNDDEEVAKVLDFGIAKLTRDPLGVGGLATQTGHIVGTPCYMSPEQAQGTKTIDWRTDLWAMAVIAFECVCGKRPFQSEAVGDLVLQICARPLPVPSEVSTVPDGFDAWWTKATARDPEQRFQSAKTLAEWLRAVLVPDSVLDTSPTRPPPSVTLFSTTDGVSRGSTDRPAGASSPPSRSAPPEPEPARGLGNKRALYILGAAAGASALIAFAWPSEPAGTPRGGGAQPGPPAAGTAVSPPVVAAAGTASQAAADPARPPETSSPASPAPTMTASAAATPHPPPTTPHGRGTRAASGEAPKAKDQDRLGF